MYEDDSPVSRRFVFDQAERSKSNLGSQVYREILGRLQRGELGPDDRMVDTALASELAVSRMPVREALLRLVHEGYLVSTTRGFMLPKLSLEDVAEIYEIRRLLEPRAAASAAQVISNRSLELLEEAHDAASAAAVRHDATAFIRANNQFRQIWLQAVPNKRLAATISRFVDQVQIIRNGTLHNEESQRLSTALGADVLSAFKERNALAVQDRMTILLDRGRERFFQLLPEGGATRHKVSKSSDV
jgi:DNA-binding GntR family transcriptional regulator